MCEFISGFINVKTEAIACQHLTSHSGTQSAIKGFVIADHREFEWTGEGENSLVVRVHPEEDNTDMPLSSVLKASILARFKTRTDIIRHIMIQWASTTLYCYGNQLKALPELPKSLTTLDCSGNQLKALPELPKSLTTLYCSGNQLKALPELPKSLTTLYCSGNQLKETHLQKIREAQQAESAVAK
jgi:hypothetical protein